jgi:hypothetical protein
MLTQILNNTAPGVIAGSPGTLSRRRLFAIRRNGDLARRQGYTASRCLGLSFVGGYPNEANRTTTNFRSQVGYPLPGRTNDA